MVGHGSCLAECSRVVAVVVAPADGYGVVGPVAARDALPFDGDADVDAKEAGEDRGGEFAGELEQSGGAGLAGLKADLAEAFGQLERADRLARSTAGEQPRGTTSVGSYGTTGA